MYLFQTLPGFLDSSNEINKKFSIHITKANSVKTSQIPQNFKGLGMLTRKGTGEISKAAIIGDEMSAVLNNCFLFITSKFILNVKRFKYYLAKKYKKPFEMEIWLIELDSQIVMFLHVTHLVGVITPYMTTITPCVIR